MSYVRLRGFLTLLFVVLVFVPGWNYLVSIDERRAPIPGWFAPAAVSFFSPIMVLAVRGLYALWTGKVLGSVSVHKRL